MPPKRIYYKKRAAPASLNRRLKRVERQQFNSEELKYHCRELDISPGSAGLGPYDLSLIPEGTADNERIGDSVRPKSLVARFNITGVDAMNTVRVFIVRVRGATTGLALSDFPIGGTNMATLGCYGGKKMKYKVLYDKTFCVIGSADAGGHAIHRKVTLRKLGGKIQWNTTTPADTENGGLALVVVSDSEVSAHPTGS